MTIRLRLVLMCLVVALLPAVPLTLLVQSLLEKSFEVGLNQTVEDALKSGVSMSREYYENVRTTFFDDADRFFSELEEPVDSMTVTRVFAARHSGNTMLEGVVLAGEAETGFVTHDELQPFTANSWFQRLAVSKVWQRLETGAASSAGNRVRHYLSDDRTLLLSVWNDNVLVFHQIAPLLLEHGRRLLEARQLFAQLTLTRPGLTRSFFYPFLIIYGIAVLLALALALWMAERMAEPLRRLAAGTQQVAAGDLSYQLDIHASGETGRLINAFNTMTGQLDTQQRRLVESERMAAWRDVARHLAHEIKNPLLPIRLTVDELKDQYPGGNEQYQTLLVDSTRVIREELDHLHSLVKEFSTFARMPELHPTSGSLLSLINDVRLLYPQLKVAISGPDPTMVFDPDQIRRVLTNLFDNVVTTNEDISSVRVDIALALTKNQQNATIAFTDNGPGIPAENLKRIFDPYFTTRQEGTGLGLAILHNIIAQHSGTVRVTSVLNHGTTFNIELPLAGPTQLPTEKES